LPEGLWNYGQEGIEFKHEGRCPCMVVIQDVLQENCFLGLFLWAL